MKSTSGWNLATAAKSPQEMPTSSSKVKSFILAFKVLHSFPSTHFWPHLSLLPYRNSTSLPSRAVCYFLNMLMPHTVVSLWPLPQVSWQPPLPSLPIVLIFKVCPKYNLRSDAFPDSFKRICSLTIWISLEPRLYIFTLNIFGSLQLSTTPTWKELMRECFLQIVSGLEEHFAHSARNRQNGSAIQSYKGRKPCHVLQQGRTLRTLC